MKNILRRILQVLSIFTSIFTLLAIISCNNVITQKETDKRNTTEDYAVLKISVDDINGTRFIEPFVDESNFTDIKLTGVCGTESSTLCEWANKSALEKKGEVDIKSGIWDFTLTAKYNSAIYSGNYNNVILNKGDSKNLVFTLTCTTPATSGSGSINVTVAFPANKAKRAEVILSDVYDSSLVAIKKTVDLNSNSLTVNESNITDGEYILNIYFYTESGVSLGTYTELVKVAANHESKANRTVTSFNELYTITYVLNQGSWVSGTTAPAVYSSRTSVIPPTGKDVQRNGFIFGGWYETSNFAGNAVTKINPNEKSNKTFYAKWNEVADADISLEEDIQTNNGVAITVNIPSEDVAELKIMRSVNNQKYHKYYEAIATDDNSFTKGAYTIYDYSIKQDSKYSYYAEITIGDSTIKTKTVDLTATVDSAYTMPLVTNVPTASYNETNVLFKFKLRPVIQHTVLPYGFVVKEPCLNYFYKESSLRVLLDGVNNMGEYSLFAYSTGQYGFTGYGETVELDGFYCKMTNPSYSGQYYIYSDDSASAQMPETLDIPNNVLKLSARNTDEGIELTLNIPSKTYNVSGTPTMNIYRNNVKIMDYAFKTGKTVLNDRFIKAGETYEYRVDFSYNDSSSGENTTVCSETVSVTAPKNGSWSYKLDTKPVVSFTSDYKASSADYMKYKFLTLPKMLIYKGSESSVPEEPDEYIFTYRKYIDSNSYLTNLCCSQNQTDAVIDLRGYAYNSLWTNSTLHLMSSQVKWEIEGSSGSGHYYITLEDSDIEYVPASLVIPSELEYDISGCVSYEAENSGNTLTLSGLENTWVKVTSEEKDSAKTTTIINTTDSQDGTFVVKDTFVKAGKTYKYTVTCYKYDDDNYKFYGHYSFELEAVGGAEFGMAAKTCEEGIELSLDIPETDSLHVIEIERSELDDEGNYTPFKVMWEYKELQAGVPEQTMKVTDYFVEKDKTYKYKAFYYTGAYELITTNLTSAVAATVDGLPTPYISAIPDVITADLYQMKLVYSGETNDKVIIENFDNTCEALKDYSLLNEITYNDYSHIDILKPDYSNLLNNDRLNKTLTPLHVQLKYVSKDKKTGYIFRPEGVTDKFPPIKIPATLDKTILSVESNPDGMEIKVYIPEDTGNVSLYNNTSGEFVRRYYENATVTNEIITLKDRYDCRKGSYYQYYAVYNWWKAWNTTTPVLCEYDPMPKQSFTTLPSGTVDSTTNRINLVRPEIEFYGVDSALNTWHHEFHYKCDETGSEYWEHIYPNTDYFDFSNYKGGLYTLKDSTLMINDGDSEFLFHFVPSDFPDMPQSFFVSKEYTVSFLLDGQEYGTPQIVSYGNLAEKPTEPTTTLNGYEFTGWLDKDGNLFDFSTPIRDDLVLSGRFVQKPEMNVTVTVRNDELEIITEKQTDGKIKFYEKNGKRVDYYIDDSKIATCKTFYFDTTEYDKGVYVIEARYEVDNRTYSYTATIKVE